MSARTYVRWQRDEPREQRVFPPLDVSHPMADAPCKVCEQPLGNGTPIQLLAIGPEPDELVRHVDGRWYTAVALAFHAACLGGAP